MVKRKITTKITSQNEQKFPKSGKRENPPKHNNLLNK
jgi:hypothetical protein